MIELLNETIITRIKRVIYKDPCMWSFDISISSVSRRNGWDIYDVDIFNIPKSLLQVYKKEFNEKLKQLFNTEFLLYNADDIQCGRHMFSFTISIINNKGLDYDK